MADIPTVKKALISLVNMFPNGIELHPLVKLYRDQMGSSFPYARFGYDSEVSFICNEMENSIRVEKTISKCTFYPKITENSGHMAILAMNTKKSTKTMQKRSNVKFMHSSPQESASSAETPKLQTEKQVGLCKYMTVQDCLLQQQQKMFDERKHKMGRSRRANHRSIENSRTSKNTQFGGIERTLENITVQETNQNEDLVKESAKQLAADVNRAWEEEIDLMEPPQMDESAVYDNMSVTSHRTHSETSLNLMIQSMKETFDEETFDGNVYPKNIINDLHVGSVIKVLISDCNNPLKFWVHIQEEKFMKEINALHEEMQDFYGKNRNSVELIVSEMNLFEMKFFAAYLNGQWHRVELQNARKGNLIGVSFIDHGTREYLDINDLRHLPEKFIEVPKAALTCALGNIRPTHNSFTKKDTRKFIKLVDNETMYARILKIDKAKSKATVELTVQSNFLCVNDELVRSGHAFAKRHLSEKNAAKLLYAGYTPDIHVYLHCDKVAVI